MEQQEPLKLQMRGFDSHSAHQSTTRRFCMDMDQAAVFLAGSILTVMGFLVILGGVLIANNLVAKYWKSWGWQWMPSWTYETHRFMTREEAEKIAPHLKEEDDSRRSNQSQGKS